MIATKEKVPDSLTQTWPHFRNARTPACATLQTIFQNWHHIARFCRLGKVHAKQAHQHKRDKIASMLEEAHETHLYYDSYRLFKRILNLLHPQTTGTSLGENSRELVEGCFLRQNWNTRKRQKWWHLGFANYVSWIALDQFTTLHPC